MTYFTNTSNKDITYKGMTVRPMETILLDDHGFPTKGEYTYAEEKLLALDDSIEKASKKAKEDLGDLDDRIEKKVTSLTKDIRTTITNITGNVDNLGEYMCGLETCIENLEARAGDAVSIANTANTAASTAQTTANTAKTNAATAKTNAATALTCAIDAMTEAKSKVTLATLDSRLSAEEVKTKDLVTLCTSKVNFDLGSYKPVYNNTALHKTDGKPVEFFHTVCCYPLKIEPGIYLGKIQTVSCCVAMSNIPLGKEWKYWDNSITGGLCTCKNAKGCIILKITPHFCYKTSHSFQGGGSYLYEIDKNWSKCSYVTVETTLTCQCQNLDTCCRWCGDSDKINNPYACVKTCLEAFAKCSVCLSNTLTRIM